MKSEWKKDTFIKYIDLIGGGTPKTSVAEYWNGSIPWLSVKDFNNDNRYVYTTEKHISEQGLLNSSTKLLQKDDIIISARGTVGELAMIPFPMAFNQSCYGVRAKDGLNKSFLYYLLKNKIKELKKITHGSVFDTITRETFSNIVVDIPDYQTQCAIASILGGLDDKIELNNKINDNLEHQAQVMFAHIRQKFEDAPERCELVSLSDLMDYAGGSQPPASEFVSEKREGYVRFVQIRDYESNAHITYIPISKKNKLCQEDDIMIARYGASLGRICFGLNGAYNVALAKFFPRKSYYREFLRCYLSSKEFFEGINNKGGRSAQAGFNQSDIKSFELLFPKDDHYIADFENCASPLFNMRLYNLKENKKLQELRDTLLPKLMSGEIDVEDVKI